MKDFDSYKGERPSLNYVENLVGVRDAEFEQKFVTLLKSEFSWDLGKYLYHIKLDEPRAAAEIVHKLKYKISVLGMQKTFIFAEEHKERLHAGDASLDEDFKKILKRINVFLDLLD
ncbi:Hpt domain-containing protein [Zobellia barbeyronii]|uniref:Hpt domain-containing protein n=1 Tax=Zobellia barbeyronii TaxID=2748009 RepID=A0ABS5WGQ3_9FLAO|nr:Hpt domain-containing protein [Zobellia barbeyronii]MBT2162570.1 Hpt domain-containing protein [Zobellia barbeyronii]